MIFFSKSGHPYWDILYCVVRGMVETFHLLSKSMENKIFETSEISLHQKIYKIYLHFESSISLYSYLQNSTKLYILPTIHNFFTLRSFFDPKTEKNEISARFLISKTRRVSYHNFISSYKPFRNKIRKHFYFPGIWARWLCGSLSLQSYPNVLLGLF